MGCFSQQNPVPARSRQPRKQDNHQPRRDDQLNTLSDTEQIPVSPPMIASTRNPDPRRSATSPQNTRPTTPAACLTEKIRLRRFGGDRRARMWDDEELFSA